MARRPKYFILKGGLDEASPPLSLDGGALYGVSNYEPGRVNGYRRIDGYERLDGQHAPSEADYWLVNFDAGGTAISEGDEVSIAASPGASDLVGEVLADAVVESGTYGVGDAAGYFYVTRVTNRADPAFSDNDTLYVSASSVATADGAAAKNGALTDADDTSYKRAAIEVLRDRIDAVPGEGDILGVWMYNGVKYAFRNVVGGATAAMFKSSASGWAAVDLGSSMAFTSGNEAGDSGFSVGETITGGTSGAAAEVMSITDGAGGWAAGTMAGTLYIKSISGGPFTGAETITGGTSGATATAGTVTATTLQPDGRYEFVNENFYGHSGSVKMYGCDGANPGFAFDGSYFLQISTGMIADTPIHITEHKKHLFFAFLGGSVQHSSIGDPYTFSAVTGAAELATGDEITGFTLLPDNALGIFNRNRTYILFGASAADWDLKSYADESGAIEWTIQRIGYPVYADDRGLMDFKAVQAYGDFKNSSFSEKVSKTFNAGKSLISASIRVRKKNQYRLFYSNDSFIICSFEDKKISGFTVCTYPVTVKCAASVEDSNGSEILLFGSDNGYVYQMDKGTSFDGVAVPAFCRIAFNSIGSPEVNKKFFKAVFEVDSQEAVDINFTPDFDYGEKEDLTKAITVAAAGGVWDVSSWDEFIWGDQLISNPEAYIDGSGQNIGLTIYSSHTYEAPHELNSVIIHYSMKGVKR